MDFLHKEPTIVLQMVGQLAGLIISFGISLGAGLDVNQGMMLLGIVNTTAALVVMFAIRRKVAPVDRSTEWGQEHIRADDERPD